MPEFPAGCERVKWDKMSGPLPRVAVIDPREMILKVHIENLMEAISEYVEAIRPDIAKARIAQKQTKNFRIDDFIKQMALAEGLTVADMKGPSRRKHIVRTRHKICYELYKLSRGLSLYQIGQALGGRDHTSVHNGVKKHAIRNGLPRLDGG